MSKRGQIEIVKLNKKERKIKKKVNDFSSKIGRQVLQITWVGGPERQINRQPDQPDNIVVG